MPVNKRETNRYEVFWNSVGRQWRCHLNKMLVHFDVPIGMRDKETFLIYVYAHAKKNKPSVVRVKNKDGRYAKERSYGCDAKPHREK